MVLRASVLIALIATIVGCGDESDGEKRFPRSASGRCSIERLVDPSLGISSTPSISADGTRIAFAAEANLVGLSGRGIDLFLLDITTGTLTPITRFTQTTPRRFLLQLLLSADGTRVVFIAPGNPTGENADGSLELFLFDAPTNTVTQITTTPLGGSFSPAINANGTRIAFSSSADLTGSNPDGNNEIFLFDAPSGIITQITNTQTPSVPLTLLGNASPSIDAGGTQISFVSDLNLTGGNPDGNVELFLFHTAANALTQITSLQSTATVAANIFTQTISSNGNRIVFESTVNLTGQNPDNSFELFLFDIPTGTFTQITNVTQGFFSDPLAINADGTRIAYTFEEGGSLFNSEIFLSNTLTSRHIQITESGEFSSFSPSISADGTRIAFSVAKIIAVALGTDQSGSRSHNTGDDNSSGIYLAACRAR